jgi:hypothetical protein
MEVRVGGRVRVRVRVPGGVLIVVRVRVRVPGGVLIEVRVRVRVPGGVLIEVRVRVRVRVPGGVLIERAQPAKDECVESIAARKDVDLVSRHSK